MIVGIFWLAMFLATYSYFVYPALLWLAVRVQQSTKPRGGEHARPTMSLVVTAYNEEARIEEKILNCLALKYPGLEIIVASDASVDRTDEIVKGYAGRGLLLARSPARLGKENAQLYGIREATGEIVVFSDVATRIPSEAMVNLSQYFSDANVGAVSSEDRFISNEGQIAGEGAYVRYEMWLRSMESMNAGLVGLSGSFFAARRSVCENWDIESPSDFNTALNCAALGLRAVSAPDVLGYYKDLSNPRKEYERKIRTALRGMTGLGRHLNVLNPFVFGAFAWQMWSHKVLRWAVPWALLCMLLTNILIVHEGEMYLVFLCGQIVFYGIALCAQFSDRVKKFSLIRLIYFFVQVNVAIADASLRCLFGRRMTTWQPSSR